MEKFRKCLSCDYERGFHVYIKEIEGKRVIGLICPKCGQSYDIGWHTASAEGVKPEKGPAY
ncbi:MAG: hypothetical protein C4550_05330 [Nitrospiraceae bacterium]|nr:MAG: hypothetical protein C4550_05330 [Nitrospiraceae bacterium]